MTRLAWPSSTIGQYDSVLGQLDLIVGSKVKAIFKWDVRKGVIFLQCGWTCYQCGYPNNHNIERLIMVLFYLKTICSFMLLPT